MGASDAWPCGSTANAESTQTPWQDPAVLGRNQCQWPPPTRQKIQPTTSSSAHPFALLEPSWNRQVQQTPPKVSWASSWVICDRFWDTTGLMFEWLLASFAVRAFLIPAILPNCIRVRCTAALIPAILKNCANCTKLILNGRNLHLKSKNLIFERNIQVST